MYLYVRATICLPTTCLLHDDSTYILRLISVQIFWQRIMNRCNNIKYYIRTTVLANLHINPLGIGNRFVYYNNIVMYLHYILCVCAINAVTSCSEV